MAKKITQIPATKSPFTEKPIVNPAKRKVCGYARVSTDNEDQETSYTAQMEYYEEYIKARADWEFVGMYSDEGISGTNTKKRDGFNRMIDDAIAGKIELIITKSVSRFARNTVDSLSTIRKLKEHGVEVYFEKENIWTLDSKGELLITIMSSLAQEESRSISENVTWGVRKRFADGKGTVCFSRFLGYDRGENGEFVINEEQAVTVRLIYKLFLSGLSCDAIAKELMERGIKSPSGKDKWYSDGVHSILTNEKYKGDALLQKQYTVDFLTKKTAVNNGEVPQYYVEDHHEAIISKRKWELVQNEVKRRSSIGKRYSGTNIFSSKIICGECGCIYGSKTWHSNDKYRKVVWQCNGKYYAGSKCKTPHLSEEEIKNSFVKAYNVLIAGGDDLIADLKELKAIRANTLKMEKQLDKAATKLETIIEKTEKLVSDNAMYPQDQVEYDKRYNEMVQMYNQTKKEYDDLQEKISSAKTAGILIDDFIAVVKKNKKQITKFDPELWGCLVESVTVQLDGTKKVRFKSGYEVTVE